MLIASLFEQRSADIEFGWQNFVAGQSEEIIASVSNEETVLLCEVDLAKVDAICTHWALLRDKRIDAYRDLTR